MGKGCNRRTMKMRRKKAQKKKKIRARRKKIGSGVKNPKETLFGRAGSVEVRRADWKRFE